MDYWRLRYLLAATVAATGMMLGVACGGSDNSSSTGGAATATPGSEATGGDEPDEPREANLTFQLNWIPNIQHFGPVYADAEGFYDEVNLNVTVQAGGQGIDGIQMVAAGAADIAVSSAANLYVANERDLDLVGFAAVYQRAANALVCRGDTGIVEFDDIKGKTVGSKGPSDDDILPLLFSKNGFTEDEVEIRPIGSASITELIAGIVDCQLAFAVNEPITLRQAGIDPVIFHLADYQMAGQGEVYFTRRDFLEENPDVLVRFLQATARAWEVYLDDPEAAAQWIVDSAIVDGLDVDQQKAQALNMAELVADDNTMENGLLYLNDVLWEEQALQVMEQGRVTAEPDIEAARTYTILDDAQLTKR